MLKIQPPVRQRRQKVRYSVKWGFNIIAVSLVLVFLATLWVETAVAYSGGGLSGGRGNEQAKKASPTPTRGCPGKRHFVKEGETLYIIAATYSANWEDIVELNGLKPPYTIYVGQELCLPDYVDKPAAQATTDAIAAKYDPKKPLDFEFSLASTSEVNIKTTNFPPKDTVRIYSGYTTRIGGISPPRPADWVWLGDFYTGSSGSVEVTYYLPAELWSYPKLWFCLKSYGTGFTVCKHVLWEIGRDFPYWGGRPYPVVYPTITNTPTKTKTPSPTP